MNKFKTKTGFLTSYALVCGYKELKQKGEIEVELWQECPGIKSYHVRAYDFENQKRLFWETFESLKEARKFFIENSKSM